MRPERNKRPPIAADGTVLLGIPLQKKPRLSEPEKTTPQTLKRTPSKKSTAKEKAADASSESDTQEPVASTSADDSPLESLPSALLESFLPDARKRVLSIMAGQLPQPGLDNEENCNGSECVGLQDQWMNLRATVKGTLQGEGNSALLIGARGSGKSLLLESVLRSVEGGNETESKPYHLVQLDGAIQPTDRLSMRELARQLVKKGAIKLPKEGEEGALDFGPDEEEEREDEDGEETTATIPINRVTEGEEEVDEERRAVENAVLSSIANTTSTILTLLSTSSSSKGGLPLIITLASFDLYTSRPRQALLYVLLDAVQAGSYTPGLCVIGMTSRLDTTDLLEKRVRSRFGGRSINVWPEDVWDKVLKRTLLAGVTSDSSAQGKQFNKAWTKEVVEVCSDEKVLDMMEKSRSISNVVRTLYKITYPIAASISAEDPSLISAFTHHLRTLSALSSYSVLADLTIPEFALLIASKQLYNRDREVFNFEMCFDELKQFVSRIEMDRLGASTSTSFNTVSNTPETSRRRAIGAAAAFSSFSLGWQGLTDRKRAMMAFRSLLQLELFQPEASLNSLSLAGPATKLTAKGAQTVRTEYLRVKCTIFPQDIITAARASNRTTALGTHLVQWATSNG